jgi:hypothetical protein
LDAAVAFVTRPGVALLREYLKAHPPGGARCAWQWLNPWKTPQQTTPAIARPSRRLSRR